MKCMSTCAENVLLFYVLGTLTGVRSANASDTERGKELYELCQRCHGSQGEGNEDLLAPSISGLPEWYVSSQLEKFSNGKRGKHPQDVEGMRMRPMARTLTTKEEVSQVTAYVSGLDSSSAVSTPAGDPVKGKQTYTTLCFTCHGMDGSGNEVLMAPPLVGRHSWYLSSQLTKFKNGIRGGLNNDPALFDVEATGMAAIAKTLDESSINDVVAYINTLR